MIVDFQNSLRGMLNWFLRPESDHLGMKGAHQEELVARHFAIAYPTLSKMIGFNRDLVKSKHFTVELFDLDEYETDYLSPIAQMYRFMNDEGIGDLVSSFILHGSMATMDFVKGWSDVDTIVVVKQTTLQRPDRLRRLRELSFEIHKFLYKVDPLQHHGLIFTSESDLWFYPSYYMPIAALQGSKQMIKGHGPYLLFNERECEQEKKRSLLSKIYLLEDAYRFGKLKHHSYHGEYLEANFKNYQNAMYQMKYFLGLIALLPAQFMEFQGEPCYKRDSFELAKPHFSPEAWAIVDKASAIRSKWGQKEKHPFVGKDWRNEIPEWLREDLGPDYFDQALIFAKELEKRVSPF